jgi:hypothetical protein
VIDNADLSDPNNLLEYKMGMNNSITPDKKEKSINSINLLLDKHFLIIKNFVIRKLIKQLYDLLQTKKTGGTTAGKESLENLLQKYKWRNTKIWLVLRFVTRDMRDMSF